MLPQSEPSKPQKRKRGEKDAENQTTGVPGAGKADPDAFSQKEGHRRKAAYYRKGFQQQADRTGRIYTA